MAEILEELQRHYCPNIPSGGNPQLGKVWCCLYALLEFGRIKTNIEGCLISPRIGTLWRRPVDIREE